MHEILSSSLFTYFQPQSYYFSSKQRRKIIHILHENREKYECVPCVYRKARCQVMCVAECSEASPLPHFDCISLESTEPKIEPIYENTQNAQIIYQHRYCNLMYQLYL